MFKVRGKTELGTVVDVVWNNGSLRCDYLPFRNILDVEIKSDIPIYPPGGPMFVGIERLTDPRAALLFITEHLEDWEIIEGEVPPLGDVPDDAVT